MSQGFIGGPAVKYISAVVDILTLAEKCTAIILRLIGKRILKL